LNRLLNTTGKISTHATLYRLPIGLKLTMTCMKIIT